MNRKIVASWVGLVMVLSFIVIIIEIAQVVEAPTIIYVDDVPGEGPGNPAENYTKIQDAINNASSGDTVFVYNGTYYENVIVNETINLIGIGRDNTTIDGGGSGSVVEITAPNVKLKRFRFKNSGGGSTDAGVKINSNDNLVQEVVSEGPRVGIYVYHSNNTVRDSVCKNNGNYGIVIEGNWTQIINCTSNKSGTFGILIRNGYYNQIKDCYSTLNSLGFQILGNEYNTIENCTAYDNNNVGFRLHGAANYCSIISCTSIGNVVGINIEMSADNNIITGCLIQNNGYGIEIPTYMIYPSNNNLIYHNNIIGNTNQAIDVYFNYWDNGYPSGGNYWSDYSGTDNFKGPDKDIPGSDGIGDTNYSIDSDTFDHYPLMVPYKPFENYTILKQGWNLVSIPLIQEEQNLTRVLGSIHGLYDAVQCYDVTDTTDHWKHHKIGKPFGNDLAKINETMGFWVQITPPGDTIFRYNGTQPTSNQSIPLHPGWNMVGFPSLSNRNRTAALNNLTFGSEVDAIWTFDAATQTWEEVKGGDYFEVGRGYWVHARQECVWEVGV